MSVRILTGDALDLLQTLPDASAQTCVTSPPYFGLRSYGVPPSVWGGDPECGHEWGDTIPGSKRGNSGTPTNKNNRGEGYARANPRGSFCQKCGAWLGTLGNEPTPFLYVDHIVAILRQVRRVLRNDGTLWLNLGDSHFGDSPPRKRSAEAFNATWDKSITASRGGLRRSAARCGSIKPKDLIGIPWRVALALQDDGWWLRIDNVWSKQNGMPEPVEDRPTKSHEYVFLLAKRARYFYDREAVREEPANYDRKGGTATYTAGGFTTNGIGSNTLHQMNPDGRNCRSVWTFSIGSFDDAHFATFPPELPERCIKAGTSERGCCPACGAPWKRIMDKGAPSPDSSRPQQRRAAELWQRSGLTNAHLAAIRAVGAADAGKAQVTMTGFGHNRPEVQALADEAKAALGGYYREFLTTNSATVAWEPTCKCNAGEPAPCTVLDCFGGAGTTGLVADRLGRDAILIELNPDYAEMARRRIANDAPMFVEVEAPPPEPSQAALFEVTP